MCLGNKLGFDFVKPFAHEGSLFTLQPGGFLLEMADGADPDKVFAGLDFLQLGTLNDTDAITVNDTKISLSAIEKAYTNTLDGIFPAKGPKVKQAGPLTPKLYKAKLPLTAPYTLKGKPRVLIPVFPGINCEYDTALAFEMAGGKAEIFVVKNLTPEAITESVDPWSSFSSIQILLYREDSVPGTNRKVQVNSLNQCLEIPKCKKQL